MAVALSDLDAELLPPARLAYPPAEVAQLLGLGRSKTLSLIASGVIPSVKIDRCRRVLHADVVAYLDSLRSDTAES